MGSGIRKPKRTARERRAALDGHLRHLAPIVEVLGLSPEMSEEAIRDRMAGHAIEPTGKVFADGTGYHYAAARSRREGAPRGNSLGIGASAGEALCHAAAQAFEDSTRGAPPNA